MKKISSAILGLSIAISAVSLSDVKIYAATQTPITRSQVEARALKMINLQWTYQSSKNSSISSQYASAVTQPAQLRNVTSGTFTGIPYDWGGIDSTDTSSYNAAWTNFTDAISKGAYAGNVNTRGGYGYIPGTAGVDCSGFVQSAFNIKDYKLSTSTMFNYYFKKISLSDIKHMDILDNPGDHVVIFDKWGTMNGISGAFTYEATPDQYFGGIQGAKRYFISMNEINSGYIPGRYINIVEDPVVTPAPTPAPVSFTARFAKVTDIITKASLRATPSFTGTLLTTIPKDNIIYLSSYNTDGWYKVGYNGSVGWISKNQVSEIPSGKYITLKSTTYVLPVMSSSSTTSTVVIRMYKDMYAEITDYSIDGTWFKVNVNGVSGWVQSKYVSYIA